MPVHRRTQSDCWGSVLHDATSSEPSNCSEFAFYYTTNLGTWKHIPGVLNQLLTGNFNGDLYADLAGLTSAGQIFYTTNLGTWKHIPGRLERLAGNTD